VQPFLGRELSLALINGPSLSVVAGSMDAIYALQRHLQTEQRVESRLLHTSHAFHSHMTEPILEPFFKQIKKLKLNPPQIPYVSNVTGTWITEAEATDPSYWAKHLRQTVRFNSGLQQLLQEPDSILLEIGPGRMLSSLAKQHPDKRAGQIVLSSLHHPQEIESDVAFLLNTLGQLWLSGADVNWSEFYTYERRHRIPLPTYPFERQSYWIEQRRRIQTVDKVSKYTELNVDLEEEDNYINQIEESLEKELEIKVVNSFDGLRTKLNDLCSSYIYSYFKSANINANLGTTYTKHQLKNILQIVPKFEKLYEAMIQSLAEDKIVSVSEDKVQFIKAESEIKSPQLLKEELTKDYPNFQIIFEILEHCTQSYNQSLTGEIESIGVLYPNGSTEMIDNLNKHTEEYSYCRLYTELLQNILSKIVKKTNKKVRILEVGGGNGSLTNLVTTALQAENIEYYFTDIGKTFVLKAKEVAATKGFDTFMEFGVFDITKDPAEQGYETSSFDIILALNVVHATKNVATTISNIKQLLVPSGVIFLVEYLNSERWIDMIWGLAEGWWYFDDDIRINSPLLNIEQWKEILRNQEFKSIKAYPQSEAKILATDHGLVIAQKSAELLTTVNRRRDEKHSLNFIRDAARQKSLDSVSRDQNLQTSYAAPRNELEQSIVEIWQDILRVRQVGIYDNFFELGGESIIALQLIQKLRQTLEMSLSPNALLVAPTPAALTELVSQSVDNKSPINKPRQKLPSCLVAFKSDGSRPPFFCIHPVGGNVFCYANLVNHLNPDQPFYGLEARGVDGKQEPLTNIKDIAENYIHAIQVVQPQGPYLLGGWSFGGLVAFEMAHQLQQQGQELAFLALIDVQLPLSGAAAPNLDEAALLTWFATDLGVFSTGEESVEFVNTLRQIEVDAQLPYILNLAKQKNSLPKTLDIEEIKPLVKVFKTNFLAMFSYIPKVYSNKIYLFRSSELFPAFQSSKLYSEVFESPRELALGWSELSLQSVKVHKIPGNHYTILNEPQAQSLGQKLRYYLDKVQ
jgi:thioesterase domain-containing protein/2-polyprenyl-3-methyl-5-hydroxy-6-metoxy-1,4-benzoquinol methylase/acyl carrier protein